VPPERFYPLVETLFETQDKWVVAKDWRDALEKLVRLAGIGKKEFDACIGDKVLEDQVTQSRLTATQLLGVNSTPTFFINGKKYEGEPTIEGFEQLLSGLAAKS
jgi:protein-disulfide isomerase